VYSILFAFGSARVDLPIEEAQRLVEQARSAPLVLLSGRTDGTILNAAESRIARERAEAVKAYLVQAGIEPTRIRATWQPIGDHAAGTSLCSSVSSCGRTALQECRWRMSAILLRGEK
jgi:hypothetical protein